MAIVLKTPVRQRQFSWIPISSRQWRRAILGCVVNLAVAGSLGGQDHPHDISLKSTRAGVHRITLEEAQEQAGQAAAKLMGRLGQLQVEAARQHRLAAESDYFPKIESSFFNMHFNKFMGQQVTVNRPIAGGTANLAVPLTGKDQTLVATTAAQPLTPLFKLRQVVHLARADERIAEARAKAGLPPESAGKVDETYYKLLVAQRHLALAKANAQDIEERRLVASSTSPPILSPEKPDELVEAANAVAEAVVAVKEQTVSLNQLMGLPLDTELELAVPQPPLEPISLPEAQDKALKANAEVVTAEQTLAKARAASALAKLDYLPDAAVLGGYVYQANAIPLLPRDFSFVGLMASYTLFDFGKREHSIKERKAQVEMAELGVQLTKAKLAATVKSSYLDVERWHQLSELRRHMAQAMELRNAKGGNQTQRFAASRAKAEVEMLEADLAYRQAITRLRILTGE